jgi:hypothetical protein
LKAREISTAVAENARQKAGMSNQNFELIFCSSVTIRHGLLLWASQEDRLQELFSNLSASGNQRESRTAANRLACFLAHNLKAMGFA